MMWAPPSTGQPSRDILNSLELDLLGGVAFACYVHFVSHLECPVGTTVLRLQPIGGGIYNN